MRHKSRNKKHKVKVKFTLKQAMGIRGRV